MGLKQKKVESLTGPAQEAAEKGWQIFVARFWDDMVTPQMTGPMYPVAEAIQVVEACGWKLDHMAYTWVDSKNRGLTLLVFRRV